MAGVEKRDFDSPDETRTPPKTRTDVVHIGGTAAARLTLEPGWRWSECVKPVAGTESCQHRHLGVVEAGRMRVTHDDGTEKKIATAALNAGKADDVTIGRKRLEKGTTLILDVVGGKTGVRQGRLEVGIGACDLLQADGAHDSLA